MNKEDYEILEEILNEELESYLSSGYSLQSEYAINLRNLIRKLNLKEIYDFDKRYKIKSIVTKEQFEAMEYRIK